MAHRPLAPGTLLANRYRIERLIKSGGFASVYVASDLRQRQRCAVKETFDLSPDSAQQFELEATILYDIHHPNLPAIWDFFQHNGGRYLVMEYIEGDDLESRLDEEGSIPESAVRDYVTQLCEALIALHTHQPPIIHRDVKPANVKITPDGKAVLVDFGIAKFYQAGNNTQAAARAVTDGFSPLEQYGQGSTDARSDIYALGATMYNLLTGIIPPDAPSRVTHDTLVAPAKLHQSISPLVDIVTMRALAVRPQDRFQSVEEMLQALRGVARVASIGTGTGNLKGLPESFWYCSVCQTRNTSRTNVCIRCGAGAPTIEINLPQRVATQSAGQASGPLPEMHDAQTSRISSAGRRLPDRPWEVQAGPPQGVLTALGGRPGQGLVACGERGMVLAHTSETWMPLPPSTSFALRAAATSAGHVWAAGDHGTVMHFTNGRWTVNQGTIEDRLVGIALDSPTTGVVLSASGILYTLEDLTPVALPTRSAAIRAVAIDDFGDGWAVGDQSLLLRLTQGSWRQRTLANGWGNLYGIDHREPGEAWAVGAGGILLKLNNQGWYLAPDLHVPDLYAVAFNRLGEGWAVGTQGTTLWFDSDHWIVAPMQPPTTATLRSVAWLNEDEAWATGDGGVVLRWRR